MNIGIGSSDLGPLLVCEALRHEWSGDLTPHFNLRDVDRTQLEDLVRTLDPAGVLVIRSCSKNFRHAGDAVECQCGARLDRGRIG